MMDVAFEKWDQDMVTCRSEVVAPYDLFWICWCDARKVCKEHNRDTQLLKEEANMAELRAENEALWRALLIIRRVIDDKEESTSGILSKVDDILARQELGAENE